VIKKKFALRGFVVLLSVAFLGAAIVYLKHEKIPDLDNASVVDSKTYDDSYASVISTASNKLDGYRASLTAPSISLAVAVNGELVWAETRGYAKLDGERGANLDTTYAIGSVSKPITSALVASLWEEGALDIDTDIRQYVPGFPEKSYPVTLRQLLSHQAGIRHYEFAWMLPTFSENGRNEQFETVEQSLALFKEDELLFEPDTSFQYSTYGYTLISAAIEGATGRSFLDLLQERVFDPLGMNRTSADDGDAPMRASDYLSLVSDEAVLRAPETNSSYKWAGGGLVSTPTDIARFGVAMLHNELLNEATSEVVFTARETLDGQLNPQHYGLGWRIGGIQYAKDETSEPTILQLINHGGSSIGSSSILLLLPEQDIVVAMTANSIGTNGSGPLTRVAASVARDFLGFLAEP
jgi:serine beta-lactamase-like protein LACTB